MAERLDPAPTAQDALLRTFFEHAPNGLVLARPDGTIILVNPAFASTLARPAEELIGAQFCDLVLSEDVASARAALDRLISRQGGGETIEVRFPRERDGTVWCRLNGSLVRASGGEPDQLIVQIEDVTERREAAERLARSRKLMARAERLANMGSWQWGAIEDRITWSDALFLVFGVEPGDFGGTYEAYLDRVHPEDRSFVDAAIREAGKNCKPFNFDHRIIRANDGAHRIIHSEGEVVSDRAGRLVQMFGIAIDVTIVSPR